MLGIGGQHLEGLGHLVVEAVVDPAASRSQVGPDAWHTVGAGNGIPKIGVELDGDGVNAIGGNDVSGEIHPGHRVDDLAAERGQISGAPSRLGVELTHLPVARVVLAGDVGKHPVGSVAAVIDLGNPGGAVDHEPGLPSSRARRTGVVARVVGVQGVVEEGSLDAAVEAVGAALGDDLDIDRGLEVGRGHGVSDLDLIHRIGGEIEAVSVQFRSVHGHVGRTLAGSVVAEVAAGLGDGGLAKGHPGVLCAWIPGPVLARPDRGDVRGLGDDHGRLGGDADLGGHIPHLELHVHAHRPAGGHLDAGIHVAVEAGHLDFDRVGGRRNGGEQVVPVALGSEGPLDRGQLGAENDGGSDHHGPIGIGHVADDVAVEDLAVKAAAHGKGRQQRSQNETLEALA